MSESFLERLSRFTPDGSALDRDALLFAAGRVSVRPDRRWMALAGLLATSQLLSLVLLWPRPETHDPGPVAAAVPAPRAERPVPTSEAPSLWELRDRMIASEGNLPASLPVEGLVPSGAPLRAFGVVSADVFN